MTLRPLGSLFLLLSLTACEAATTPPITSADGLDVADGSDTADGSDATDTADGSDATDTADGSDATDKADGSDATDTADGSDATDTADGSDATDGTADPCSDGTATCGESQQCEPDGSGGYSCVCGTGASPSGSNACVCAKGLAFDGAWDCEDIDECAAETDTCGATEQCVNKPGSHSCVCGDGAVDVGVKVCKCKVGFEFNAANNCVDVDECAVTGVDAKNCGAGGTCLNTTGGWTCVCNPGLTLTSGLCCPIGATVAAGTCVCQPGYEAVSGVGCVDKDECAAGTDTCGATELCVNNLGSHSCVCGDGAVDVGVKVCKCKVGFEFNAANNCVDVDECAVTGVDAKNCGAGGTCLNTTGGWTCVCNPGLTLTSGLCCPIGATVAAGTCVCQPGYEAVSGVGCVDKDECAAGTDTCGATELCVNNLGSHSCVCGDGAVDVGVKVCQCKVGFEFNAAYNCVDVDECLKGTKTCGDYGTCVNAPGNATCTCPSWMVLSAGVCCPKGATWVGACMCPMGYRTELGVGCVDIDECAEGGCGATEQCENSLGGFACGCGEGAVDAGVSVCKCSQKGFVFDEKGDCVDVDECAASPCGPEQACVNAPGSYLCTCTSPKVPRGILCCPPDAAAGATGCSCPDGTTLDGDECVDVDECATEHPCGDTEVCTNLAGSFTCTCGAGAKDVGVAACACAGGFAFDSGRNCVDIDECVDDPCASGFDCVNTAPGYGCECPFGTIETDGLCCPPGAEAGTGECGCTTGYAYIDGQGCVDVNECNKPAACGSGASCTNTSGDYLCACSGGAQLQPNGSCACPLGQSLSGGVCVPSTTCVSTPCATSATCSDSPAGAVCTCPGGTTVPHGTDCGCPPGNKLVSGACVDVDECAATTAPCHATALCTNSLGSFSCTCGSGAVLGSSGVCSCAAGLVLDASKACVDIDECALGIDTCASNATCGNLDGAYECLCPEGYVNFGPSSCKDVDECLLGNDDCGVTVCRNTPGSFDCASSLLDENSPYYANQCTLTQWTENPTSLLVDCRCNSAATGGIDLCISPQYLGAEVSFGSGPRLRTLPTSRYIGGGFVNTATNELIAAIGWTDEVYTSAGFVMAVDVATGDRRIVSGKTIDPQLGYVDVGSGPDFLEVVDIEAHPTDGAWYTYNYQSFATPGGIRILKLDPATGARTLVWSYNVAGYAQCNNGATGVGTKVAQLWPRAFTIGPDGGLYVANQPNGSPKSGVGVMRIATNGQSCTWITHSGASVGNTFATSPVGAGYPTDQSSYEALSFLNGKLMGVSGLQLIEIDTASGFRKRLSSANTAEGVYGAGPVNAHGIAGRFSTWDPALSHLITTGSDDVVAVDPVTGNRIRFATCLAIAPNTLSVDCFSGPAGSLGLNDHGFWIHPTTGNWIVGHSTYTFMVVEPQTGNSFILSL